ncbi:hypothetical protein ACFS7Z_17765 [Pontibacter toksunensis]|uniref:Dolichyl-phosphate-mannose-protein mannosyltransferase n=1 Tax=Pontibacter toksunensis TaxID=1332631 RepID=A0ABW6C1Q6_9BACT
MPNKLQALLPHPQLSAASEKRIQVAFIILWTVLHTLLFFKYGVRTTDDSWEYLKYAQGIADEFYFANNYYMKYLGYPLFLALLFKLGLGLKGVIIVQTLLSGIATVFFYRTTKLLAGNSLAPALATFILIIWYDLQLFHAFIMTESLYVSLLMYAFYLIVKAGYVRQSLWAVPVLLYVALVRPNGFIAVVAYAGYLITLAYQMAPSKKAQRLLIAAVVIVPLAAILVVDQYLLQSFTVVETYEKGEVIYLYKGLLVHSDKPIVMPPADASPLTKLYLFVRDNTSYFFRMSALRFLLFWGNVKPFFSVFHNTMIALLLYPMYFFGAKALLKEYVPLAVRVFGVLLVVQQAFITTITSENETGRFLMSVVFVVFAFGATGISWQIEKWKTRRNN